jgi:UDP-N-acetylglucosamine 4,6-dehydratase/5-epimerase
MLKTIENKKVFITGGAGYLGKSLIKRLYGICEITVYSRDEAKHYYLKKKYPDVNFCIGDIRDLDSMLRASRGHQIGIFAASLKQIESVDQNPLEGCRTIIDGSFNSRRICEENNFEAGCFISSDKSRAATTLYGSMKFVAGESFIVNAEFSKPRLSTVIYGNVLNSTGSVIPLIWDSMLKSYGLTLYSTDMTRFVITRDQAVDLILYALTKDGYNIIPNLKSILIKDLFEVFKERYESFYYCIGEPRVSEKIHEIMIASEEIPRIKKDISYYLMHYRNIFNDSKIRFGSLCSSDSVMSKIELVSLLERNDYFKP